MAKYQITAPDGKSYEVTAPDTASQDEVLAYAQANYKPQGTAQPEKKKSRSWSDVPLEAIQSIPSSAGNFLSGIAQAVSHPIDTASTLFDAAAGGLKNALPKSVSDLLDKADYNPKATERAVNTANAVGNLYKTRYGSMEGLKETIATDPVGFAGDLSTVLGAGGSLATKGSKVSSALKAGADYTNPFNAIAPAVGYIGEKASPMLETGAKKLMQSALKPTIEQLKKGHAETAINTLLSEGINATRGGVEKLKDRVSSINDEISNLITNSSGTVDKQKVLEALGSVKNKFSNQVSPTDDLAAIERVAKDFANHPYFQRNAANGEALKEAVNTARRQKEMALQASGKLDTFAAQQKNLAEGGRIPLSINQPEFQPYFNTGTNGRVANSPSSQPVDFMPRIPSRYTHNIDRVPEGIQGANEARQIYSSRRAEELSALKALDEFEKYQGSLPIQLAQQLKQGTYKVVDKKYGQLGNAETEAQKALARGLKEGVAEAAPEVAKLNAKESDLINTLKVTERRALMDANKNPMGLALLAHNPASWAAFMADKSALFKSLAARTLNKMSQPNKLSDSLRALTPEQTRLMLLSNQAGQQNP